MTPLPHLLLALTAFQGADRIGDPPRAYPDPPAGDENARVAWALERLADPAHGEAREAGARMLLGLGDAAAPALLEATRAKSWRVRARAFDLLPILGREAPPESLGAGLEDDNRAVRAAALRSVREGAVPQVVEAVARRLEDPLHDIRLEAVLAAFRLRADARASTLVERVGVRLGDPDAGIREAARAALVGWGAGASSIVASKLLVAGPFLGATLRQYLEEDDPPAWAGEACRALLDARGLPNASRGGAAALSILSGERSPDSIRVAVAAFLDADEFWSGEAARRALRRVGEPARALLAEGLRGSGVSPARLGEGIDLLVELGGVAGPTRLLELVEALAADPAPGALARRAVGFERVAAHADRVQDPERLRRAALSQRGTAAFPAALKAIAAVERERSVPLLLESIGDEDPDVRQVAVREAARLGGASVADALARAIETEAIPSRKREFVERVAAAARAPAIRAVLETLALDAGEIQGSAVRGLAEFHRDPLAVAALDRAFAVERGRFDGATPSERDARGRRLRRMVEAAGAIGGEEARRFLVRVVRELGSVPDAEEVTRAAVGCLARSDDSLAELRALLETDPPARVALKVGLELAGRGEEEARILLVEEFRTLDVNDRLAAVDAIARGADGSTAWFLLDIAGDEAEEAGIRRRATEALVPFGARDEVRAFLVRTLREGADLERRLDAAAALSRVEDASVRAATLALVLDAESIPGTADERREIVRDLGFGLASSGDPDAAPALAKLAFDGPLGAWRESFSRGEGRDALAGEGLAFEFERPLLAALVRLGAPGAAAIRGRIESARRDGRLLLVDPRFLFELGRAWRDGAPDVALACLDLAGRTAAGRGRLRLEALRDASEIALDAGAYELASRVAETLLLALREGRFDRRDAREVLGEEAAAAALSPRRRLEAQRSLARGLEALARGEEAAGLRAFDEALASARGDSFALGRVALAFSERPGLERRAVEIASDAVERAPGGRFPREALAWCRLRAGDAAGALYGFEAAFALPPRDARESAGTHLGVAAALTALDRLDEAAEALARALALVPGLREAAEASPLLARLRAAGRFPPSRPGPSGDR